MKELGRGVRRIAYHDSLIFDNEYRIALRTSDIKVYMNENRIVSIDWDYHFMVQTDTGNWAEKHGPGGATVYHSSGNPDTISWDNGYRIGYYTSDIIYFAITN